MFGDPVVFLIGSIFLIPAIFVAIPAHELGHGIAAQLCGDPSPRNRGFLRPRPMLFVNVYGVLAAILINVGFGSPIPVNEYRLQGVARKVIYALGGPLANLLLAIVFGVLLRTLVQNGALVPAFTTRIAAPLDYLGTLVYALYFLNLSTFAFQLLPIPGLDGWRVLEGIFRGTNPRFFFNAAAHQQTIWIACFALVFFGPLLLGFSLLGAAVGLFFQPSSDLIVGQCSGYTSLFPCLPSGR